MAYSSDQLPSGLEAITTVDAGDLLIAGDASDSGRVKKITIENFETGQDARATALTNKTISADSNTLSGIAASSFVVSNGSGNIDGSAAQKVIPAGVVVGDTDTQNISNKTISASSLSGVITLLESTSIDLDPAQADGTWTGITRTGTAGAALAFGDLCYLAVADSRWELADADALATAGNVLLGMCVLAAAADGNSTRMLLYGNIQAASKFPALTVGAGAYVGETAGAIQVAIPTGADNVIRVVGYALTADELMFNPSQDWQVSVA